MLQRVLADLRAQRPSLAQNQLVTDPVSSLNELMVQRPRTPARRITAGRSAFICSQGVSDRKGQVTAAVDTWPGNGCGLATQAKGPAGRPGILLDRDGTIIVDHGYVGSVDRVEFIDGAAAGDRRVQPGRDPGRGGDEPVRRGPGAVRHRRRRSGAPVHRGASGRARRARSTCSCTALTTPRAPSSAFARSSEDRKPRPGMARAAQAALTSTFRLVGRWRPARGHRPRGGGRSVRYLSRT